MHILAKPTGGICNLACSYRFFLDKEELYEGDRFRMSEEMLDAYVRQLIAMHRVPQVTVAWQGGEPILMGLDFYRRAMELEGRYREPGMSRRGPGGRERALTPTPRPAPPMAGYCHRCRGACSRPPGRRRRGLRRRR